jgi:hypothetical protein
VNTALALIGLTGSRRWPDPRLLEDTLLQVWHDALQDGYRRARAAGIPVHLITTA